MPSTPAFGPGFWLRVRLACTVLLVVTGALLAVEASLFAGVAYGVLYAVYGALTLASVDAALALVAAVVGLALVAFVVFAVYSAAQRAPDSSAAAVGLLVRLGVVLLLSWLVMTYLVIDWLGFPRWVFVMVVVTLLGGIYFFVGLQVADEWSSDDAGGRSSDGPRDWSVDSESTNGVAVTRVDELRAVLSELHRLFGVACDRVGVAGLTVMMGLCLAGLGGLYGFATGTDPGGLLAPLAGTTGLGVAAYHAGDVVRAEQTRTAVLRDVDAHLGPSGNDDRQVDLQHQVGRLAAQLDLPAPDVRLTSASTPTAMAVGYRPSTTTLVLSTALVDALDDRELRAVVAHELAHVANHDAAVLTALSVPRVTARQTLDRFGANPVVALLALSVSATARLCVAVVSRAREYAADDGAVAVTGDPAALASALETLDAELGRRPTNDGRQSATAAFAIVPPPWEEHRFFDRTRRLLARRLLGTHPPTERRIERLQAAETESVSA